MWIGNKRGLKRRGKKAEKERICRQLLLIPQQRSWVAFYEEKNMRVRTQNCAHFTTAWHTLTSAWSTAEHTTTALYVCVCVCLCNTQECTLMQTTSLRWCVRLFASSGIFKASRLWLLTSPFHVKSQTDTLAHTLGEKHPSVVFLIALINRLNSANWTRLCWTSLFLILLHTSFILPGLQDRAVSFNLNVHGDYSTVPYTNAISVLSSLL